MMTFISILSVIVSLGGLAEATEITCTLRHSAVARLDERSKVDVHTTDNDEIRVKITGIGEKKAIFNDIYELTLIKREEDALYYLQHVSSGVVMWVYFSKSRSLLYCKLRSFPLLGNPDSYLMIGKVD